jgi:hypothetical protein
MKTAPFAARTVLLRACVTLALASCGSSSTGAGGAPPGTTTTSTAVTDVRGDRYCEILIGKLAGTSVHVEVYNTYLLNDCPDQAWASIDPNQIKAQEKAAAVILNGPRYWVMDGFEGSSFVDATPRTFGGLEMRLAGTLDLPPSQASGDVPYAPRTVARTTTWVYGAGQRVYELVDPSGRVFDMQSYSVQKAPQTMESLAALGAKLALPAGWTYRSRVLDADLRVTAVNGQATVVQDDLANTYQLSQQAP